MRRWQTKATKQNVGFAVEPDQFGRKMLFRQKNVRMHLNIHGKRYQADKNSMASRKQCYEVPTTRLPIEAWLEAWLEDRTCVFSLTITGRNGGERSMLEM